MLVNYSSWDIDRGNISYDIYIDESKSDYKIQYTNGSVLKQCSPFQSIEYDWNNDGDIYSQYGAWFSEVDRKGNNNGIVFLTPEEMVRMIADDRLEGYNEISITGIAIPFIEDDITLAGKIEAATEINKLQHVADEHISKDKYILEDHVKE